MKRLTVVLIVTLVAVTAAEYIGVEEISNQLVKYATNQQSLKDEDTFSRMVKLMSMPSHIYRSELEDYSPFRQTITCISCRAVFRTVIELARRGVSDDTIIDVFSRFCKLFNFQTESVCKGVMALNVPIITYIIRNQPLAKASSFCGLIFQSPRKGECRLDDERFEFTIEIPESTRSTLKRASSDQQLNALKIVHLTDAHIDPEYEPFGVANCNEPLCCRRGQQTAKVFSYEIIDNEDLLRRSIIVRDSEVLLDLDLAEEIAEERDGTLKLMMAQRAEEPPAGYWGDYRHCDSPLWAFEDIIDHAAENNDDTDFVYYTGDTIDHGVWRTSQDLIKNSIDIVTNKISKSFSNIPVFGILGNHEAQPVNQFGPISITDTNLTTKWIYDFIAAQWSEWLPEESQETIKRGGFYTVTPISGFRIIVLNTNAAYRYNWWLVYDPVDPYGQLKWLVETLLLAEQRGEIVHILSHIPPGTNDIFPAWSRECRKIIDRFSHIIAAEFNGHTHTDEFKVFYDKDDPSMATNIAWNGAAMTTYSRYNPNYKVVTIDGSTYEPLDIDTYSYNLTEANLTPDQRPRWFKSYSFKETYGLESLKPQVLHDLVHRMASKSERHLLHKYIRYWGKESDLYLSSQCDEKCEIEYLCKMVTTELWNTQKCDEIREAYKQ